MRCDSQTIATYEAIGTSVLFSAAFVASLYLPCNAGPRDEPRVVRSRLLTLALFAAAFELYVLRRAPEAAREAAANPVLSAVAATLVTACLYAGHLLALDAPYIRHYLESCSCRPRWLPLRDYLLAPVLEELVFRRHSLLIWRCMPRYARIVGPAALFSLAHLHHATRAPINDVAAQLIYTFTFGAYAAAIYVYTRSVAAPIAAHIFCNVLGLPDIPHILRHKRKNAILCAYLAAVLIAFFFAKPLLVAITPTSLA